MAKNQTLRVAVVHAEVLPIPPVLGGAIGQTIYETVLGMPDVDWTVISRWDDALQDKPLDARFQHVDVEARVATAKRVLGAHKKMIDSENVLRRFCYVEGVIAQLKMGDYDLVQIHNRPAFLPYLKKHLPQEKFVLFLHNEANYSDARVRQGITMCDKLVCVSHYLAHCFGKALSGCQKKTTVIHNGVDECFWHPRYKTVRESKQIQKDYGLKRGQTVLFVGRTVPNKGLHCLIEAMILVRQHMPEAHLLVVGSPLFFEANVKGYHKRLKRRAKMLGDGVTFVGFVNREKLRYYYAVADVMVVPSLWAEPFGKVVTEAMSMAVPVIASNRGGISEILAQEGSGILLDKPKDAQTLAHHVLAVLKNKKGRLEMGAFGRQVVKEHFGSELRFERLRHLYRDIVND